MTPTATANHSTTKMALTKAKRELQAMIEGARTTLKSDAEDLAAEIAGKLVGKA